MKKGLNIIPVSTVDEVLAEALTRVPVPIEWEDDADTVEEPVSGKKDSDDDSEGVVTH